MQLWSALHKALCKTMQLKMDTLRFYYVFDKGYW